MAEDPTQRDKKDFRDWIVNNGQPQFADPTTMHWRVEDNKIQSWKITAQIASNKEDISNNLTKNLLNKSYMKISSNKKDISSNLTERDNSKEEGKEPKDVSLNLNGAPNDNDDKIDNPIFQSSVIVVPPLPTSSISKEQLILGADLVVKTSDIV